tara:strand:+ start:2065 stop:2349 length:285 start_codon:yes stop_codon:yes gene_type:complete
MSYPLAEHVILDARSNLFYELHTTGDVRVNGAKRTIFDLLEYVDAEEKDNVFSMLVRANENAQECALEFLSAAFNVEFDDEAIENHIINEAHEL